jgi:glycosyltransferase involved in cell wall biosynthesis
MSGSMRILFVHDNFPAQFGPIGEFLAERGADVAFCTARKDVSHPTIRTFSFAPHRAITKGVHPYAAVWEKAAINGQAAARVCFGLKRGGYSPDVIVAHSGWGPGVFLKDVWPNARYIGYFEWYYQPNGPDVAFLSDAPQSDDELCRTRARNAPMLADLAACDAGLVPTLWQRAQFPKVFAERLTVMHDGILTDLYAPTPDATLKIPGLDLSSAAEIVTYIARGMEPYRGFPEFMAAAEIILKRRPSAHVVVVGEDRVAYGKKLGDGESHKERALASGAFDLTRLHFTGLLPRPAYLKVLQASSVHVYLTVPFVLSWSMMEAMSAGCLIVASDTEPVRELIKDGENGYLAPFRDPAAIAEAACEALDRRGALGEMRKAARDTILSAYAARDIYPKKEALFRG